MKLGKRSAISLCQRAFCSEQRAYEHRRDYSGEKHVDWFRISEPLTSARNQNELHFAFLEGPPGSGKKDILYRLSKLKYTVLSRPFLPLLTSTNSVEAAEDKSHQLLKEFIDESRNKKNVLFQYFPCL